VLVLDGGPVDADLASWQAERLAMLHDDHPGLEVEDEDEFEVGGATACYRMLGWTDAGRDLLSEQWCWLVDGVGYTLTATVDRVDYADFTDLFEEVASSFVPPVPGVGRAR
jgi:hypothetical protein